LRSPIEPVPRDGRLHVLASSRRLGSGDLEAFHHEASDALPHPGGNYLIVTDATGNQRVNMLKPFGEALPRRPPFRKIHGGFDSGSRRFPTSW
jgi:hypothetical protein